MVDWPRHNHAFTTTVDVLLSRSGLSTEGSGEETGSLLDEDIGVRWLLASLQKAEIRMKLPKEIMAAKQKWI